METAIVIIGVCFVVLAICGISTNCESTRNKYKIRDLEAEVEHLKDVVRTESKFATSVDDRVNSLISASQATEVTISKMSDELMKMNDLDKRICTLEKLSTINIPTQGQTWYPPCYFEDGICTNPFHDCINCPRQFGSGGTITTTGAIKKD